MYEPEPKYTFNVKRCLRVYRACLGAHLCLSILQLFTPRPYLFICHFIVFLIGVDCFCSFVTFKYFFFTAVSLIAGVSDFLWIILKSCGKYKLKWLCPQYYWKTVNADNMLYQYFSSAVHYIFDEENKYDSTPNIQKKYEYMKNLFKFLPAQKKIYVWKIYLDLFILIGGLILYFFGSYISWHLYKYSIWHFQQNDFIFDNNTPDYGTFTEENNYNIPSTQTDFVPFVGQPYRIADYFYLPFNGIIQ